MKNLGLLGPYWPVRTVTGVGTRQQEECPIADTKADKVGALIIEIQIKQATGW